MENSELVKILLNILIDISSRKTDRGHAIYTMEGVMEKLKNKYIFLKNVQVTDNRFIENKELIDVSSGIDDIDSTEMGRAINDIITTMHYSLGDKAGHFFIKDLQRNLEDKYSSHIQELGVDLSILQLEKQVKDLEKTTIKK